MARACRNGEATPVATPPARVRRTASRASGADSTAATERFSARAWSSCRWVEDWTTPSATAAATAAAATAAASRGSQGLRAGRRRAGGPPPPPGPRGDGGGQPGQPGAAGRPQPGRRFLAHLGRQLPGDGGGGQDPLPQPGRRAGHDGQGQPGGGLPEAADLVLARRALLEMMLELTQLQPGQGVQRVHAGQPVQVMAARSHVAAQFHQLTPMQSRIRIRPSRTLVLMVPRAVLSSDATSGYVYPL